MKREKIYKEIADLVSSRIGDGLTVELHEVVKSNDNVQHGLVIRDPNISAAPVLYLEPLLEEFGREMSTGRIADEIIRSYREIEPPPIDLDSISLEFEDIKDKVELRLVGAEMNRQRLKEAMYLPAGNGLVLIPYIKLADTHDGIMQCMITKEMADLQKYDLGELFRCAMENTVEKYPPVFRDIGEMVLDFGNNRIADPRNEDFVLPENSMMLVLSTEETHNGAVALFYPDMQQRIGEILGENYYVIPSSIHETMIVPESSGVDPAYLQQMLKEGNGTVVAPEDVLSSKVMKYNVKMKCLDELKVHEKAGDERSDR